MSEDFVVAGGGPSGLHFARYVADQGFDVTVLDRGSEYGIPKKSTAGTFEDLFEHFGVPKSVVMSENDSVVYEGRDERLDFESTNYVLEYGDFQEWLAEDAVDKGAEIVLDSNVQGYDGNSVEYTRNGSSEAVEGEVLVDATGPQAALMDRPLDERWVGFEQEMRGVDAEDEMIFILDQDYAPGGYAWIFSTDEEEAKVGVCWSERINEEKQADGNLQDYFEKLWEDDDRLQDAEIIPGERHAGDAYSNTGLPRVQDGNVVGIGDTVDSLNPVLLEGIRPGMYSAEMAADAAIQDGEVSADELEGYGEQWRSENGADWFISKLVQEVLYSSDNERIDGMLSEVENLEGETDLVAYDFSVRDVAEVYSPRFSDVPRVAGTVSRHLRNRFR